MIGAIGGMPAKMNLEDGKICYCDIMEGFVPAKGVATDYISVFENKVLALNSMEDNLAVFDLEHLKCRYVSMGCQCKPWTNYVAMERYGTEYYIFPKYQNKLLRFDIEKSRIEESVGYLKGIDALQCACRTGNDIWLLPQNADAIICFNLPAGTAIPYQLDKKLKGCVHAIVHERYVFILNSSGNIYRWDTERMKLDVVLAAEVKNSGRDSMSRIIYAGNKLILLPAYGDDIHILDTVTGKMEVYCDYPTDFWGQAGWLKFYGYCEDESTYYVASCFGNYLLQIDKKTGNLLWLKHRADSVGAETMQLLGEQVIVESNFGLTDLLAANTGDWHQSVNTGVGDGIYRWLMK